MNGRAADGRFTEGNQLARGNPFNRRMAEMRQAMFDAVSAEDLQDIVRQVVVKARLGDLAAAKLVLSYVVGKPAAAVEPDRVDLDEWQLHTERPALSQVQRAMAGSIRPDLANLSVKYAPILAGQNAKNRGNSEPCLCREYAGATVFRLFFGGSPLEWARTR